jgi:nucleotide-binding universal stress UspA family protein
MDEKLVTVAIHTYERALILKGILESKGIEACLHNVNLIQPVVSAGVRVRIRESDLPAALKVIEDIHFEPEEAQKGAKPLPRMVLVPVDFSEYTLKAARLAFSIAKSLDASIVLLHTYYSPFYAGGMPISDAFAFDEHNEASMRSLMIRNETEMNTLMNQLRMEVASGSLPDVQLVAKYREGVPEEQILLYAKKHQPLVTVMGTQGQTASSHDLLGSVAAEVMDRSLGPVLAMPDQTPFDRLESIRTVGFLTRFDQHDLIAFDSMMKLFSTISFKVYFIHFSTDGNPWDEIQMQGIKEYFKQLYPKLDLSYAILDTHNAVENLNAFVRERNIDLLAVGSQKRGLFARLFNPGIAHRMVFHGTTPLLSLRG